MDTLLIVILGLLTGGVINALADDLPAARMPRLPRYPDGRRRPRRAWLGITAFALGLRGAREPVSGAPTGDDCERRRLTWRHPLVEVATAALMALAFAFARDTRALAVEETLIWLALAALFVLIAVIDLEHLRVLFAPMLACGLLGLIRAIAFPQSPPTIASMLVGAACAGFCLFAGLFGRSTVRASSIAASAAASDCLWAGRCHPHDLGRIHRWVSQCIAGHGFSDIVGRQRRLGFLFAKSASGGYRRFSAMPYAPYILISTYLVMLLGDELNHLIFGL